MNMKLDKKEVFSAPNFNGAGSMEGLKTDSVNGLVLDATTQIFFSRQLELVMKKTFDVEYEDLVSERFIPVDSEGDMGTSSFVWYSYGRVGFAKFIADMATDLPRVDMYGTENSVTPRALGCAFGYNIFEIARATKAKLDLQTKRAENGRRANEEKMDNVAWFGSEKHNLFGLLTFPGTTEYLLGTSAIGSSTKFGDKTSDEMLDDLNGIIDVQDDATFSRKPVNTIIMAKDAYNVIKNKRLDDSLETTVLKFFKENNPEITMEPLRLLNEASDEDENIMVAYHRNPDTLVQRRPIAFERLETQKKGFEYVTDCVSITAGTIVYYPTAVTIAKGC